MDATLIGRPERLGPFLLTLSERSPAMCAPKAEVTGSNPVGSANSLEYLAIFAPSHFGECPRNCPRNLFGRSVNMRVHAKPKSVPVPETLRQIARDIRQIGCGFRCDPESIAIQKDEVPRRILNVALRVER